MGYDDRFGTFASRTNRFALVDNPLFIRTRRVASYVCHEVGGRTKSRGHDEIWSAFFQGERAYVCCCSLSPCLTSSFAFLLLYSFSSFSFPYPFSLFFQPLSNLSPPSPSLSALYVLWAQRAVRGEEWKTRVREKNEKMKQIRRLLKSFPFPFPFALSIPETPSRMCVVEFAFSCPVLDSPLPYF